MNKIVFSKNEIVEKEIDSPFCKKFFKDDLKDNKCKSFLLLSPKTGKLVCPFGYACARGYHTMYCGFLTKEIGNTALIKRRNKYLKTKGLPLIDGESHDLLINIVENRDYCLVASQAAHDFIHLSGQLKTLIDEANKQNAKTDQLLSSIIKEYQKYISSIETYQKSSVAISRKFGNIKLLTIEFENNYWNEKKQSYLNLISAISDISSRIHKLLENVQYEEKYKNQYVFLSLVSMQSIFIYRIKYHNTTVNEMFGGEQEINKQPLYKYNWHKIAKKLANILSYQGKLKNARFAFDGTTHNYFLSRENVFLALYILFENAIKYCVPDIDGEIVVAFKDNEKYCSLSVSNSSSYISSVSMSHITEKGKSGENSANLGSNGIGLYVVKKIFDENNISVSFNYSDDYFVVDIQAKKCE